MRRLSSINLHRLAGIALAALAACPVQAGIPGEPMRPLPPLDLAATPETTHGVRLSATNPSEKYYLHFEVEVTVDGVRSTPPDEREVSQPFKSLAPGEYRVSRIQKLTPETKYCYRMWSRLVKDDVQSAKPSQWACAVTLPFPPLAPLDLSAKLPSDIAKRPRISWGAPDQSGHRRIDRFVVERQTSPVPGRPWLLEGRVPGPSGEQHASTQLEFAFEGARIDTSAKQLYRVRAENRGGHSDWVTVELVPPRKLVQTADSAVLDKPPIETAPRPTPPPDLKSPFSTGSTAAANAGEARPQAQSKVDPSGTVALNPQPLPPKQTLPQEQTETLFAQDATIGLPATDTFKKFSPVTLMCRGGEALTWGDSQDRGPPRRDGFLLTFLLAPGPVSAQGLGLAPSQCGLVGHPFPADRHQQQVYIDKATATFKTTTGTYAPVTRTTSIQDYLKDINHFWTFDVMVDVTRYSADFTPERHVLVANLHQRLELPTLVEAGKTTAATTSGEATSKAFATTGKTGKGPMTGGGASTSSATQPSLSQARAATASTTEPSTATASTSRGERVVDAPSTTGAASPQSAGTDRGIIIVGGNQAQSTYGTKILPKGQPELIQAPTQTLDGTGNAKPQTQIQGTASSRATGVAAGANAQAIDTVELVCRGGSGLRIESKGAKENTSGGSSALVHLIFSPAFEKKKDGHYPAAGPEGTGLVPSSCSFANQEFPAGDPQLIVFETALHSAETDVKRMQHDADPRGKAGPDNVAETRPDEKTIPLYLAVPDHYWSFTAYRTNYGSFVATEHRPWKPKSGTAIQGTAGADPERDSRVAIGRLHNIKVFPELRGVGFQFIARPDAAPFVEIGKEKPVQGRDGIWVLRDPLRMKVDRDNRTSSATVTTYVGASRPQSLLLDPATQYHYIITVPAGGTAAQSQQTGAFKTLTRTAKIKFTGIHVLNDSDEESDGDLTFGFFANPGEPTSVQRLWDEQSWEAGPRRRINEELVVSNAPDRLRIVVSAFDDDKAPNQGCTLLQWQAYDYDSLQPRKNNCREVNFAKAEIDLSKPSPAGGSFNLNSFGPGPHGVTLIYSVSGYVELAQTP